MRLLWRWGCRETGAGPIHKRSFPSSAPWETLDSEGHSVPTGQRGGIRTGHGREVPAILSPEFSTGAPPGTVLGYRNRRSISTRPGGPGVSPRHPNLASRSQETLFEAFARQLAQLEVCPNLLPDTWPTGGDSKVDAETHPVADSLSAGSYVGAGGNPGGERWAFALGLLASPPGTPTNGPSSAARSKPRRREDDRRLSHRPILRADLR